MCPTYLYFSQSLADAIQSVDTTNKGSAVSVCDKVAKSTFDARCMVHELVMAEAAEMRLGSDAHLQCEREMMLAFLQSTQDSTSNMRQSAKRMLEVVNVIHEVAACASPALLMASDLMLGIDKRPIHGDSTVDAMSLLTNIQKRMCDASGITENKLMLRQRPDFAYNRLAQDMHKRMEPIFQFTGANLLVGAINTLDQSVTRMAWNDLGDRHGCAVSDAVETDAPELRQLGVNKRIRCVEEIESKCVPTHKTLLTRMDLQHLFHMATQLNINKWWMATMYGGYLDNLDRDISSAGLLFCKEIEQNTALMCEIGRSKCLQAGLRHFSTSFEGQHVPMLRVSNTATYAIAFAMFSVWRADDTMRKAAVPFVLFAANAGYDTECLDNILLFNRLEEKFRRQCAMETSGADLFVVYNANCYAMALQQYAELFLEKEVESGNTRTTAHRTRPPKDDIPLCFVSRVAPPHTAMMTEGFSDVERTSFIALTPWISEYWVRMYWMHLRGHYPLSNDIPPAAIVGCVFVRHAYAINRCLPCDKCQKPGCMKPSCTYSDAVHWICPLTTDNAIKLGMQPPQKYKVCIPLCLCSMFARMFPNHAERYTINTPYHLSVNFMMFAATFCAIDL